MIRKTVLDNGLRVISEAIPSAHSVTIGVWVEAGSRHESGPENGMSHFVEHMLFKGTSRRSARDIAREMDSMGGMLNAFTSREYSCYYAKTLAGRLPQVIDLLGEVILDPRFDLDELEKERRVVLQEICMVEDTPDDCVHDLFNATFWGGHPLGHPILGNMETVGAFERSALIHFMKRCYTGSRVLVCAAGDLNHERLVDQLDRVFSALPETGSRPETTAPVIRRNTAVTGKDLEQVHLCLGTRALPQNHPDRFAAYLLNAILGGSMSSRLFQEIREQQGLAYSIYSYLHSHTDAGSLVVYAATAPEDTRLLVELILRQMRRLRDEPLSAQDLSAVREQLRGNLLLSMEATEHRMSRLAKNEIYLGRNLGIKEVLRGFDQVSAEDVQDLAGRLFRDEYLNLHLLGRVDPADISPLDLTLG